MSTDRTDLAVQLESLTFGGLPPLSQHPPFEQKLVEEGTMQSVASMLDYENYSFEELRYMVYLQNGGRMSKYTFDSETIIIKCIHCKGTLSVFPVYMYEDESFVCGRCSLVGTKNPVRQLAYECVAKYRNFKCSFKEHGCLEEMVPKDLVIHEASCTFRKFSCTSDCSWIGSVEQINFHYKVNHPHLIFDKTAEIITKAPQEILLIASSNKLFQLYSKITESELKLSIAFIGATEEEFECTVLHADERNVLGNIIIQPDVRRRDPRLSYTSSNVEVEKLLVSVNKIVRTELEVTPNAELERSYNAILELLRCDVCMKNMVPPILVCSTGKSICKPCSLSKNMDSSDQTTYFRNYNLEKLTELIRYYCPSCGKRLMGSIEKVEHEIICPLAWLKCLFCDRTLLWVRLIDHLKSHTDHSVTNTITVDLRRNIRQSFVLIRKQCVFIFNYVQVGDEHHFNLCLKRWNTVNDKFDFILTFKSNKANNNVSAKFRTLCSVDGSSCRKLPLAVINLFKTGHWLSFHVDIVDRNCRMLVFI